MTSDAKSLTPASIEFVSHATDGSEHVVIPRFRDPVVARIHAWATGYGDPDYSGGTAFLKLSVNGEEIAAIEDSNFCLYSLEVDRTVTIPAKTETTIEMTTGNHLATEAGDPPHGFVVTIEAT